MKQPILGAIALSLAALAAPAQAAGSLQVSPVMLEMQQPSAVINLTNPGDEPVQAQVRILKWQQVNGKEMLVPTRDVVASPPQLKIVPGGENVVRVVRIATQPAQTEETYRLLVDQLPKPVTAKGANISFLMRYSIPVFFGSPEAAPAELTWDAEIKDGKLTITASNSGDRRVRLTGLKVTGPTGPLTQSEGLAGYVLAGATNTIAITKVPKGLGPGSTVKVAANTESGPVQGTIRIGN